MKLFDSNNNASSGLSSSERYSRNRSGTPQSLPSNDVGSAPVATTFSNVDRTAPRGLIKQSY
ncbi:hypothetical protein HanPSC8_Chr03g0094341 [Helianthus annuus]|nr:hypothetical protein HanPSC8_Chr03g0094341 [Helianthus annuus]